jgi:ribosomal protein S18 acetylase RimI-like enzyme
MTEAVRIEPATAADQSSIVALEQTILDDMALRIYDRISRENLSAVIITAGQADGESRYAWQRATVARLADEVVGVMFGYPSTAEPGLDVTMQDLLASRFGVRELVFPDSEVWPDEWYLDSIAVAANMRGQGIGQRLLGMADEVAKLAGQTTIGLNVDDGNPAARALYERVGFQPVGDLTIGRHHYQHLQRPVN